MLIKDPYLESHKKDLQHRPNIQLHLPINNTSIQSQPIYNQALRNRAHSYGQANDLKARVKVYEKQMRNMEDAYIRQQEVAKKMLGYHQANRQYHEAMKMRNFELNTKLKDVVNQIQIVGHKSAEEQTRYTYDKDILLKKYQDQTEEMLRLRANFNGLLEQKTRLEEQLTHLSFLLEKEAHQHELQIKEQVIRIEGMDRTYKSLISAKDQEIGQLIHRLRIYEDENRKLVDINKTLQLTKDKPDKIDNLSQIHHPQSNIKSYTQYRQNKENEDGNILRSTVKQSNELKEQKTINDQMRRQMEKLKKEMKQLAENKLSNGDGGITENVKSKNDGVLEVSKWKGLIASISTLREGINKEIFEMFFKSVRDGEKRKQNSLVIFIENWKCLSMERLQPYIRSYFQARNNLKEIAATKNAKQSVHFQKIQEVIPLHIGSKPGRNNINQWILSTIQFTKNQKDNSKKILNNFLLFLFRLLTIEYRIKFPMQGKSYQIDIDVMNELQHEIIKGIELIFKYQ